MPALYADPDAQPEICHDDAHGGPSGPGSRPAPGRAHPPGAAVGPGFPGEPDRDGRAAPARCRHQCPDDPSLPGLVRADAGEALAAAARDRSGDVCAGRRRDLPGWHRGFRRATAPGTGRRS